MNASRLGLLTGTHAVNDLYQGLVPALLPFMVLERGYSYTEASGLMLAATGLSSVVQPLFGLYADKRPRTWLIPAGFALAALGVVLAGLADSYVVTWLAAVLCGIGIAAYHPIATVAARTAGGSSQRAMSIFSVGGTIGASFAPFLAAHIVGRQGLGHSHWLAVPALAMALLWFGTRLGRETTAGPKKPLLHTGAAAALHVPASNDWRKFALLVAVIVAWSIPYVTVMSMLSLFVGRELGGSTTMATWALTGFTAAGAVGTLLGGWLADRRGRMLAIRAGYLLSLPAMAMLALSHQPIWAAASTAVLGMAMFLPFASQVTLAQDYLPLNPALASGIALGLALSIGGLVSPLLGLLSDHHGLRTTLACVLLVLLTACAMAWRLRNRTPDVAGP